MTPTLDPAPPAVRTAPTGPMLRALRRMLTGPLVAARVGPARVRCTLGGCEVNTWVAAGLIARGLIREREVSADRSEYALTPDGRGWATMNEAL